MSKNKPFITIWKETYSGSIYSRYVKNKKITLENLDHEAWLQRKELGKEDAIDFHLTLLNVIRLDE